MSSDLLKLKKEKQASKFIRQDTHKKKKLDKIWRRPRGHHSKLRQQQIHRVMVKPGYGCPAELKGKTVLGKEIVHISNTSQVAGLDPKKQVCVVSGKLGLKKQLVLLEELSKHGMQVLGIKDPEAYIKQKKAIAADRKKAAESAKKKEDKKQDAQAKKDSIEDKVEVSDEEKKKLEKKEIDRLLTKKF